MPGINVATGILGGTELLLMDLSTTDSSVGYTHLVMGTEAHSMTV